MQKQYKDAGFTYLNQRRNTTHTNRTNILVINTYVSDRLSQRKTVYWPDKINQIRKPWLSGNLDCLVN